MKAFLHRLHLGSSSSSKEKEREQPPSTTILGKEKFPPLRQWPPVPVEQAPSSSSSYIDATYKPLPEIIQQQQQPQQPQQQQQQEKKVAFMSTLNEDDDNLDSEPPKSTLSKLQTARASISASSSNTDVAVLPPPPSSSTNHSSSVTPKSPPPPSTRTYSPYLQKLTLDAPSIRSPTPYSHLSTASSSKILAPTSWSQVTEEDLVSNLGARERTRQEVLFEIIFSEERYVQELMKMKETFVDPLLHPFSKAAVPLGSSTPNLESYDYYREDDPATEESTDHLPPIAARFMSPSPTRIKEATNNLDTDSILETEEEDDDDANDNNTRKYNTTNTKPMTTNSKINHPRSPYRTTASSTITTKTYGRTAGAAMPFPSRSHMSLPPPPRAQMSASTHSLGKQSTIVERDQRERKLSQGDPSTLSQKISGAGGVLRRFRKSQTSPSPASILGDHVPPHQLPEDLRICLEVVDQGVLDGHRRLAEALKKRYDEQYPLIRSLADVFVLNSDIFHGYAKYVLHLERALDQVDSALHSATTKKLKPTSLSPQICSLLQRLELSAADKGETGLSITLSKPFQRLLKYPLLFQNLLFHTDPSTYEYEATLQMVAEVESIVRSIEDEKIQKEERDKTRDVFARIEGLDKVKQLAAPKPSRVLMEERQVNTPAATNGMVKASSPPPVVNAKGVRGKSSFKRLSDVLHNNNAIGGKKDLWLVVFNDVVLQCQRTGTTSVPLVSTASSSTAGRANSLPELSGKAGKNGAGGGGTTGRRGQQTKPRNLYKFIKIETWAIGDVVQPREGVVSMEDVVRSRTKAHNSTIGVQPRIVPLPADKDDMSPRNGDLGGIEDSDSDDSDRKSKMSFSYWGADKITVQKPLSLKSRTTVGLGAIGNAGGTGGVHPRRGTAGTASYGRESSANAKFGTRLVSSDHHHHHHHGHSGLRPASRRTTTPTATASRRTGPTSSVAGHSHAQTTDDSPNLAKATVTRPAWGAGAGGVQAPGMAKRNRNTSQTSAATTRVTHTTVTSTTTGANTGAPAKVISSPAPSDDSGVGLGMYRQIMAQDPSLND